MYRYYSTHRPLGPGACPEMKGREVHNFDYRQEVPEVGCMAWGYVDYPEPITEQQAAAYELVDARLKTWYGVVTTVYNDGRLVCKLVDTKQAAIQPESTSSSTSRKDVYIDWFASREEAESFVEESKSA